MQGWPSLSLHDLIPIFQTSNAKSTPFCQLVFSITIKVIISNVWAWHWHPTLLNLQLIN